MKEEIVKIIAGILEVDVYDIEMDTAVGAVSYTHLTLPTNREV